MSSVGILRWWLFAIIVLTGGSVAYSNGIFNMVYSSDTRKLSVVIFIMFLIMSLWCGVKTYILSHCLNVLGKESYGDDAYKEVKDIMGNMEGYQDAGWFVSDLCLSCGMVGTVIGFIMMLGSFGQIDIADTANAHMIMANLSSGMAVALITTLVGLICSMAIKVQYFNLQQVYNKIYGIMENVEQEKNEKKLSL
jgi:hypothetical protein